eukprot:TRINITY_DN18047_c0_g1_i4.p2 TRINITY_DN18047_c0_g1~~TRINITY_DN18047_c0_g1_i4.p2  ORF type:complete len:113 (-),score=15.00 TRINITY_DN18047_c0_g1_i4:434-772(-)
MVSSVYSKAATASRARTSYRLDGSMDGRRGQKIKRGGMRREETKLLFLKKEPVSFKTEEKRGETIKLRGVGRKKKPLLQYFKKKRHLKKKKFMFFFFTSLTFIVLCFFFPFF